MRHISFRRARPLSYCLLLACCLLLASFPISCGILDADDPEPTRETRWIAVTAVYSEINEFGAPIQRIALVDFDQPSNYRVLAYDSVTAAERPRLSPNEQFVVFENHVTGLGTSPHISLLDLETEEVRGLFFGDSGRASIPLQGKLDAFAWDPGGRGFYAAQHGPAGFGAYVYYYDIGKASFEPVGTMTFRSTVVPYGLLGRDSLIVFSDDPSAPGSGKGYFIMDLEGRYLARIDNPQLEHINIGGITKWGAYYPTWNDDLKLFTFSRVDSTVRGFKIAVTDLEGSPYREYTSGEEYLDRHPDWGPSGTILFDRVRPGSPGGWRDYRVMVLQIKKGAVRELVEPAVINGAAGLRFPDYGIRPHVLAHWRSASLFGRRPGPANRFAQRHPQRRPSGRRSARGAARR